MGPLAGLRVVELQGLGPAPYCGMLLADMGAEVISVTRPGAESGGPGQIGERGKRSIALNLKTSEATEMVLRLCEGADALIEGFRPGVMERLGLGPAECHARNPKLVYGRMTGWGQSGPLATAAGHDINYIALSGALHAIGRPGGRPVPPLNLVGDFGGGGMLLAFGVMCALFEAGRSGQGQVVDAAMVEGAASLMTMMYGLRAQGQWRDERGANLLDGGSPFYDTYETRDERHIAIGPLEPPFFRELIDRLGLPSELADRQYTATQWPELRRTLAETFRRKTRDEWCELLEGTDVCFAPVLSMGEAPAHPHNQARGSFVTIDGVVQPGPVPKFARTAPAVPKAPAAPGADTAAVLAELGYDAAAVAALRDTGVIG